MSYSSKARKALGKVKQSAATKNAQKNRNDYDKKLSAIGPYRNGTFAKMVEGAVDDILNRRAQSSNFGNADVFGDMPETMRRFLSWQQRTRRLTQERIWPVAMTRTTPCLLPSRAI